VRIKVLFFVSFQPVTPIGPVTCNPIYSDSIAIGYETYVLYKFVLTETQSVTWAGQLSWPTTASILELRVNNRLTTTPRLY